MPKRDIDLMKLLAELFSCGEMGRLVQSMPGGEDILQALRENLSPIEMAEHIVKALMRRGYIDRKFFKRLSRARPGRRQVIARLATAYGYELALPRGLQTEKSINYKSLFHIVSLHRAGAELPANLRAPLEELLSQASRTLLADDAKLFPLELRVAAREVCTRPRAPRPGTDPPPCFRIPGTSFRIGVDPITVGDFIPFHRENAYSDDTLWDHEGRCRRRSCQWKEPLLWTDQQAHPERPLTGVSFYEAHAYCRWRSERLSAIVRLPTVGEWVSAGLQALAPESLWEWCNDIVPAEQERFGAKRSIITRFGQQWGYPNGRHENRGFRLVIED